ncbi:4-alpha-glucanotransferase [Neorhizobium galegae]|uniref:4-alpha-glucanotransferase n=1 Tax=Neorhizobium galegae TaxID=399 RepID=UPI002105D0F6|nr:4-alpha-glucanotransferase [Neorhizobium galegae]
MAEKIGRLALDYGLEPERPSPDGRAVLVSSETKRQLLRALNVDIDREYKDSPSALDEPARRSSLDRNSQCFLPALLSSERIWGLSLQLYELRSQRNWGIGDFEDLKVIIDLVSSLGGDFVGLNPMHAPFLADAGRCSPYEPSSRFFLNPLYIAVDKLPGFDVDDAQQKRMTAALRGTDLVEYGSVASAKLSALRSIWERWKRDGNCGPYSQQDFGAFSEAQGKALQRHALFETLSEEMVRRGFTAGWHSWPQEYRDPQDPAVASFAIKHDDEVRFHVWLQWLTHRQLSETAEHARTAGLRIGLYLDLAVGEALDGSATWSDRDVYLTGATVGSPPDPFAPNGQDWSLAGYQPGRIASGDDSPFRRIVSQAMRYAGAIRIDHAAVLRRLYLVPLGSTPADGAYVTYPEDKLLQILAEASTKYRCIVIGEDLGLLPDGLRDELAAACILSYRILSYERDDKSFKPASAYPRLALACISTHDHQTLAGWWRGADIAMRGDHGIVSEQLTEQHEAERQDERRFLLDALEAQERHQEVDIDGLAELTIKAHRFIAKTPSLLAAVRLADLSDEKRPTNVPGTSESYPNWRPKLSVSIEDLRTLPLVKAVSGAMREGRASQSET